MTDIVAELFDREQYSIPNAQKSELLAAELERLTAHHRERSALYAQILEGTRTVVPSTPGLGAMPFLPVRLFKQYELRSIASTEILRTLTSSGTSGSAVSRIYLDKETSLLQTKALASIVTSYLGKKRLPMIIIDSIETIKGATSMSARGAGLVGLSTFGRDHFYALDESMELRTDELIAYLDRHQGEPLLMFGFTFMIWEYLVRRCRQEQRRLDLSNAVVIHGGGWKKMIELAVTNSEFKVGLREQFGLTRVHNFYGMVEQVGSIYMECEHGAFHCPNFSEIIIRDPFTWAPIRAGVQGVIQTVSVLPKSYPGHSLLTEDLGRIHGVDDCPCGRLGTYFSVEGRVPRAELRGCSDTHAASVTAVKENA